MHGLSCTLCLAALHGDSGTHACLVCSKLKGHLPASIRPHLPYMVCICHACSYVCQFHTHVLRLSAMARPRHKAFAILCNRQDPQLQAVGLLTAASTVVTCVLWGGVSVARR